MPFREHSSTTEDEENDKMSMAETAKGLSGTEDGCPSIAVVPARLVPYSSISVSVKLVQ